MVSELKPNWDILFLLKDVCRVALSWALVSSNNSSHYLTCKKETVLIASFPIYISMSERSVNGRIYFGVNEVRSVWADSARLPASRSSQWAERVEWASICTSSVAVLSPVRRTIIFTSLPPVVASQWFVTYFLIFSFPRVCPVNCTLLNIGVTPIPVVILHHTISVGRVAL